MFVFVFVLLSKLIAHLKPRARGVLFESLSAELFRNHNRSFVCLLHATVNQDCMDF